MLYERLLNLQDTISYSKNKNKHILNELRKSSYTVSSFLVNLSINDTLWLAERSIVRPVNISRSVFMKCYPAPQTTRYYRHMPSARYGSDVRFTTCISTKNKL